MSLDENTTRDALIVRFAALSRPERTHALRRTEEKLRIAHNRVGNTTEMRVGTPDSMSISDFQVAYPGLYAKLAPHLGPYVSGDRLTEDTIFNRLAQWTDEGVVYTGTGDQYYIEPHGLIFETQSMMDE